MRRAQQRKTEADAFYEKKKATAVAYSKATKAAKAVKAAAKASKALQKPIAVIKVAGTSFRESSVKAAVDAKGEVLVDDRWTTAHTVTLRKEPNNA